MTTTNQTIAEQTVAMQSGAAAHIPAEVLATFAAEQRRLDAAGPPSGVATTGSPMPDGDLLDAHGAATTLEQARGGRAAVVVFYRGAWCPYCNLALRTYEQQLLPALSERAIALVAISPQKPDGTMTTRETNELSFPVLSDPGNQIASALDILTTQSDEARRAAAALGLDLAAVNADGADTLPMPTVVLVDAGGVIRWIDVHPNYATRTEPSQVLDAVASTRT